MIAIDTNVLVRYFLAVEDDETERAIRLIENDLSADMRGFVTAITLCEIIWVLRDRYQFGYESQAAVVQLMLDAPQLQLEHEDSASAALASRHPDIADALIHHIGQSSGCLHTLTLDKKFARLAGVMLLV